MKSLTITLLALSTVVHGIEVTTNTNVLYPLKLNPSNQQQRDSCSSGSQSITQVTLGQTYEVCCPGTAESIGDIQYCCVGGNTHDNKKRDEKRDLCFPFCFSSGSDSTTTTSSCITKVPVTAADYSDRVSSTTATTTSVMTTATATATATTELNATVTTSRSTSSGQGGAAQMVNTVPFLVGMGLIVMMNGILLLVW
ncbi:hypothetical protein BGW36DRAFT_428239 [Talaromyces proteolyticus]|uniref:WSC domain-containing protein n=1 Tax=Talaromyces proteolyticus TaxID=1131652 RepID=A0AAD4KP01_9EURO|nr:uncharacterized protein BGW36DRAFT_428239 [Talaromyces proteolyticus]KAH8696219.1 hypothetical protein BGW36DRAFT_428239 [Talaromyces proteolyticus]